MRETLTLLAALTFVACGPKSPTVPVEHASSADTSEEADEPAPTTASAVAAGMDMLEHVAAAIATGESCTDMAAALTAWIDGNHEEMDRVTAGLRAFSNEAVGAEVKTQMADRPIVQGLFETASGCANDPAFQDAWERAGEAMSGS